MPSIERKHLRLKWCHFIFNRTRWTHKCKQQKQTTILHTDARVVPCNWLFAIIHWNRVKWKRSQWNSEWQSASGKEKKPTEPNSTFWVGKKTRTQFQREHNTKLTQVSKKSRHISVYRDSKECCDVIAHWKQLEMKLTEWKQTSINKITKKTTEKNSAQNKNKPNHIFQCVWLLQTRIVRSVRSFCGWISF